MCFEDDRSSYMQSLLNHCLRNKFTDPLKLKNYYKTFSLLNRDYLEQYGQHKSEQELIHNSYYETIELSLHLSDPDINPTSAEELARILQIDAELCEYCERILLEDQAIPKIKREIICKATFIAKI